MPQKCFVVAIDGPSGTGKSSTAKEIARRLAIDYLDTGAMYRALSLKASQRGVASDDADGLGRLASELDLLYPQLGQVFLDGVDVSKAIRTPEISGRVSADCAHPQVREVLVERQRQYALGRSCALDGRDVGTVVFPHARFKFYVDCDPRVRARRRLAELEAMGVHADYDEVLANLVERDRQDSTRAMGPLRRANDAILVDTSHLTFEEQVERILSVVRAGA
ncbi:MAG: (d)CMP kinase [Fibrobacterota bacterium]|nr:MAG: (d)CMP kinase [Fibrobacterota bacterium]